MANYLFGDFTEIEFLKYDSKYLIEQCPFEGPQNLIFNNCDNLYSIDFIDTKTNELWDFKYLSNNILEKRAGKFISSEIQIPCTRPDNNNLIMYTFSSNESCGLIIRCLNGFALIFEDEVKLIKKFINKYENDIINGKYIEISNSIYIKNKNIHIIVNDRNLKKILPVGIHNLYNYVNYVKEDKKILVNYFLNELIENNLYSIKPSANIGMIVITNEIYENSNIFNILEEKEPLAKRVIDNSIDYFCILIPNVLNAYKLIILNKNQLKLFFHADTNLFNCTFGFSKEKLNLNSKIFNFSASIIDSKKSLTITTSN